jgi:photosynthetic reaction center cytochrome c subunit
MRKLVTGGLLLLLGATTLLAGCERPPIETVQAGFRGTGMMQVNNPRTSTALVAAQKLPDAVPAMPAGGPTAKESFKNVQVLGELSAGEFTRTMLAITAWVAPEKGCAYCHAEGEDLSSDKLYTKVVARKMLQMTRHINTDWKTHVAETGVTCYTCHRGQPVPAKVWFTDPGPTPPARTCRRSRPA